MDRMTARLLTEMRNKREDWYRIVNKAGTADIHIYNDIGTWEGLSANDFISELKGIKSSHINLYINSKGGDVFDGLAIYEALKEHPAHVDGVVQGIAASIASVVAMACDKVRISRNGQMMIHDAHSGAYGSPKDVYQMYELLERQSDNIADIYAQKAGGTKKEWRSRMESDTWYFGEEAVKVGLADELTDNGTANSIADTLPATKVDYPVITNRADDEGWAIDMDAFYGGEK